MKKSLFIPYVIMASLTVLALHKFITEESLYVKRARWRIGEDITTSLASKSSSETIADMVYFTTNDILELIEIALLFQLTPHREVCEYLIKNHWDVIGDEWDEDCFKTCKWKIDLIEGNKESDDLKPTGRGDTIWCDGACNPETMPDGWGSVVDNKGNDLLDLYENASICAGMKTLVVNLPKVGSRRVIVDRFDDVKQQQHNGLELMALVVSLRLAAADHGIKFINSDSQVAISWSTGVLNAGSKARMDKRKYAYVVEAAKLRKEFETRGGKIVKVSGDDQLADLGFHKN